MQPILIDTTVTYHFSGDRVGIVEAGELSDLNADLFAAKGYDAPVLNSDGKPKLDEHGNPVKQRMLDWPVIVEAVTAFFAERSNPPVKLTAWEARGVWDTAGGVWEKKRASWREPAPAAAPQTSPPSGDPRYSNAP